MKFNFRSKVMASVVAASALALASGSALAGTPSSTIDLTAITGAFSASDIIVAVLAVAGVLAAIYAAMTAAKMALKWIRGG